MAPSTKPELTRDDIKNGWTEEKLEAYLIERQHQQAEFVRLTAGKKPAAEIENTRAFDPHRW